MKRWNPVIRQLALALALASWASSWASAENLQQAWAISLSVNQGLQAQKESSIASSFDVKAAVSSRYFTVQSYNIDAYLIQAPHSNANANGSQNGSTTTTNSQANSGVNIESFLPISLTTASIPLYTGGRLLRTVDSYQHLLQAQKTEEFRTAIDLKLTVAEAYIGVLRAKRNLDTARSNTEQLASFSRDVANRLGQGLAIRSDDLAAKVSLANAQISEIQARTSLESAWATYNRYLCRPLDQYAELEEISDLPTDNQFWSEWRRRWWRTVASSSARTTARSAS